VAVSAYTERTVGASSIVFLARFPRPSDITPVSEEARLFVAAEAVLGIVVIGAFLSVLALGRRRERATKSN
jgi:hypothetical protein